MLALLKLLISAQDYHFFVSFLLYYKCKLAR